MQKSASPPGLPLDSEQLSVLAPVVEPRPLSAAWMTDELISETRRVWSPYYGRVLSEEDAIEILQNVKRFAELLWNIKTEMQQE